MGGRMTPGIWTNPQSDLKLIVYRVFHIGNKNIKIRGLLVNKRNGIIYQKIKKVLTNHHMIKVGELND